MDDATAQVKDTPVPVTIADQSLDCAHKFKLITRKLQTSEQLPGSDDNLNPDVDNLEGTIVSAEMMKDVWARFNVWTGNIGALNKGRASLDYRLRHADVLEEVLRLLKHMNTSLSHLWDIVSGVREQDVWYSTDTILRFNPGEFTDSESDDSEEEDYQSNTRPGPDTGSVTASEPAEVEPQRMTESKELFVAIGEALSGLFQLSMFIHKSTRRNKFASFTAGKALPETQIDIRHVHDRFPFATKNQDLIERLGKANARRRQWLMYKRRHREKLAGQTKVDIEAVSPVDRPNRFAAGSHRANFPMAIGTSPHGDVDPPQLSPFAPSDSLASGRTALSSTVASTFYGLPKLEPDMDDPPSGHESEYSATTYSESAKGESNVETSLLVPQPPPESANGNPFECPYCFQIVTISGRTAWTKHVHSDLSSYICTFESCSHPPFESRHQWFSHEIEVHRLQWFCGECPAIMRSEKQFHNHIRESHSQLLQNPANLEAVTARAARPVQSIPATDCPLCDYDTILKQRRRGSSIEAESNEAISLTLRNFRNHLGRHLEQLALFVLPRTQLMELPDDLAISVDGTGDKNAEDESDYDKEDLFVEEIGANNHRSLPSTDVEVREGGVVELDPPSLDQINLVIGSNWNQDSQVKRIATAPELAMGWLPPMNFTPPEADFHQDDVDLIPRREDSMFGGDLFTPGWVRGYGKDKEGYCGRCEPGVWLNMEDGSYERNLVYQHGIHTSGIPLARPSNLRQKDGEWQGYCDACNGWRTIRATDMGWSWFRHCDKEHSPTGTRGGNSATASYSNQETGTIEHEISRAIKQQDTQLVKNILDRLSGRALLDIVDSMGRSAVHQAADIGNTEALELLIQAAGTSAQELVDRRSSSGNGETALMLASMQGNDAAVLTLIKADADVNAVDHIGQTALDYAATAGYPNICKLLIDAKADISNAFYEIQRQRYQASQQPQPSNEKSNDKPQPDDVKRSLSKLTSVEQANWPPLMIAAASGDIAAVKSALAEGADIDARTDKREETALMIAATNSKHDIVHLLLSSGANVDATNAKGWTTLMLAVREYNIEVVSILISYGADVNHLSPDRWTALAEATYRGYLDIMQKLLECGADTESRSMHDWTPLMHAAFKGDSDAVALLLAAGADMNVVSLHDETALLLAAAGKHTSICLTLLTAGCNPEAQWVHLSDAALADPGQQNRAVHLGWTPLMLASQNGLREVVERLLWKHKVRRDPRSPYGKTAREIAKENGHAEVLKLFELYQSMYRP